MNEQDAGMTPDEIRAEAEVLRWKIEDAQKELDAAEHRLYELKHDVCRHPNLKRTGAVWPHTDDCPDCGMMFYLDSKGGKEEHQ